MDLEEEVRLLREENAVEKAGRLREIGKEVGTQVGQRTTHNGTGGTNYKRRVRRMARRKQCAYMAHEKPKTTKYRGPATSSHSRTKRRKNV